MFSLVVLPVLFDRQRWWLFHCSAARTRSHEESTKSHHPTCSSNSLSSLLSLSNGVCEAHRRPTQWLSEGLPVCYSLCDFFSLPLSLVCAVA